MTARLQKWLRAISSLTGQVFSCTQIYDGPTRDNHKSRHFRWSSLLSTDSTADKNNYLFIVLRRTVISLTATAPCSHDKVGPECGRVQGPVSRSPCALLKLDFLTNECINNLVVCTSQGPVSMKPCALLKLDLLTNECINLVICTNQGPVS